MAVEIHPLDVKTCKKVMNGQMYDLLSYDEYAANPDIAKGGVVAVRDTYNGRELALPYKGKYTGNPINPGIYNAGCIDFVIFPHESEIDLYLTDDVIEFSNHDGMKETLQKREVIKKMKEPWITSPDNITIIPIQDDDQPEMKCLKTALNKKQIDIDKYASRFGDNFPNDKRQLKNKSSTLNIIKRFADKFDMEAILKLRDASPDVPNPMNCEIEVSLTDLTRETLVYEDDLEEDVEE